MNSQRKLKIQHVVLLVIFFSAILILTPATDFSKSSQYVSAKQKTDRSIRLNIVVDAPPDSVFELWSTAEGSRKFFGRDAVIELAPGGKYEIYFLPRTDPKSDINSSRGAKLLGIEKNRYLAFEWTMPPFAREYNIDPLPTWVEVSFRPLKNQSKKTHVHLEHLGFGRGGKWDQAYEFFVRGWSDILFRLDVYCSQLNHKKRHVHK